MFCPRPISAHHYSCDLCGAYVDHPWFGVAHACPDFLRKSRWAFLRLLATLPKFLGSYMSYSTTMVQPTRGTSMSVSMESDKGLPAPPPPPGPKWWPAHRRASSDVAPP